MKRTLLLSAIAVILFIPAMIYKTHLKASLPGAEEVVQKAVKNAFGEKSMQAQLNVLVYNEQKIDNEIDLKVWQNYPDEYLVLVTAPARYRGNALLRKNKEVWQWQPTTDKLTKLTRSDMAEKWMDTHLTVADFTNYHTLTDDFTASFKNLVKFNNTDSYIIELVPNSEAMQTWSRMLLWVNAQNYIIQKTEYYDEDDYLITTAMTTQTEKTSDRVSPRVTEWVPAGQPNQKTTVTHKSIIFNQPLPENFFSIENMKIVR